jgi:hypothetical protein
MVQNSSLTVEDENEVKSQGEELNLNKPQTYDKAINTLDADEWIKAMDFELNVLEKICIWEVAQPPVNTNIVGSKWVFCYKYNPSSLIIKIRA